MFLLRYAAIPTTSRPHSLAPSELQLRQHVCLFPFLILRQLHFDNSQAATALFWSSAELNEGNKTSNPVPAILSLLQEHGRIRRCEPPPPGHRHSPLKCSVPACPTPATLLPCSQPPSQAVPLQYPVITSHAGNFNEGPKDKQGRADDYSRLSVSKDVRLCYKTSQSGPVLMRLWSQRVSLTGRGREEASSV